MSEQTQEAIRAREEAKRPKPVVVVKKEPKPKPIEAPEA